MRRAITWTLTAFLLLVLVGVPAAIACSGDSEGLELVDGELPGGG
jgi:hypothetical protein